MAFVTVSDIIDSGYGGLYLKSTSIMPTLVSGEVINKIPNGKKGLTAQFRTPTELTGRITTDLDSDITVDSVDEGSVSLSMATRVYQAIAIDDGEMLASLENAMAQVVMPMVRGANRKIESFLYDKVVAGFARYMSGTAGTQPSTAAHLAAAEKVIFDNEGDVDSLVGVVNSTAYSSLAQIVQNVTSDYQGDMAFEALRNNRLNKINGITCFRSHAANINSATFDQGYLTGTIVLNGVAAAGATTLAIDGFTAATGTIYAGTRFTIAGTATIYTVTSDATIAGNATTLSIFPALTANEADGDAITFQTAFKKAVVYNPMAVIGGVLAGAPLNATSGIIQAGPNIQLQLTELGTGKNLQKTWVLHGFVGASVVVPKYGCILQG